MISFNEFDMTNNIGYIDTFKESLAMGEFGAPDDVKHQISAGFSKGGQLKVTIDGRDATYSVVPGKYFDTNELTRLDNRVHFAYLERQIKAGLGEIRKVLQAALGGKVQVL